VISLKDSWRVNSDDSNQEHEIGYTLWEMEVMETQLNLIEGKKSHNQVLDSLAFDIQASTYD